MNIVVWIKRDHNHLVYTKVRGADGGALCTRDFPNSEGAVVTSEGARHTLASM